MKPRRTIKIFDILKVVTTLEISLVREVKHTFIERKDILSILQCDYRDADTKMVFL